MSVRMCVKQQTDDLYMIICNCKYSVVINCGWNNNVAVKIVAYWNRNVFTSSSWLHGEFVFTIHVRRDPRRPIWFHPLKLTFSTCFRVFVAQQWHGAMLSGGLAKGQWAVLRMTTEGGDWVVLTSHFYRSYKGLWKSIATLCRLCDLYCGLTVLKLIW